MSKEEKKNFLIKKEETFAMFGDISLRLEKSQKVLADLLNSIVVVADNRDASTILCEHISSLKLAETTLKFVFKEEYLVKEGVYQADPVSLMSLKSCYQSLKILEQELLSYNISLESH